MGVGWAVKVRRKGGWLPPQNILSRHFEKYLLGMVLKLSGHVRNTISLLYMQKTGWNSDIWNFFSEKIDFFVNFGLSLLKIRFLSPAMFENVIVTSYAADFHDFGINGKRRPYPPIPWYQTIILWTRQFQVHKGVVTPLGKPCTKKGLVGRGLNPIQRFPLARAIFITILNNNADATSYTCYKNSNNRIELHKQKNPRCWDVNRLFPFKMLAFCKCPHHFYSKLR